MLNPLMPPPPEPTPSQLLARNWGDRVRGARGDRPQTWLAEFTGYDQTTISRIEAGKARFTPDMMLALAVALEKQLDELFPYPDGLVDAERFRRTGPPRSVA